MKKYSKNGYKKRSEDKENPYNLINSNQITMNSVEFPVLGIDNLGNTKLMKPGAQYIFPGNQVFEVPLKSNFDRKFAQGGKEVVEREGVRYNNPNIDDSHSTHVMAHEFIEGVGWVAFPTLFQVPTEDGGLQWVDLTREKWVQEGNVESEWNWGQAYQMAEKLGEVYEFGYGEEALKQASEFAQDGYKESIKQKGGSLPKAQTGYDLLQNHQIAAELREKGIDSNVTGSDLNSFSGVGYMDAGKNILSHGLDILSIPGNLMAEGFEGLGGYGDKRFNFGDAMPGFSGDLSFTNMYGEQMKNVANTVGIENPWLAFAANLGTDPSTYVGAGIIKNLAKKGVTKVGVKSAPKIINKSAFNISKFNISTTDILNLAKDTEKRLLTDKFIKNNMKITGRSREEVINSIQGFSKQFDNANVIFDDLGEHTGAIWNGTDIVMNTNKINSRTRANVLGNIEHEIEHIFSDVGNTFKKSHPTLKVSDDIGMGNFKASYYSLPYEQQVRFRKSIKWLEQNAGLKMGDDITDAHIDKLSDAIKNWSKSDAGMDFGGIGGKSDVHHLLSGLDYKKMLSADEFTFLNKAPVNSKHWKKSVKDILNATYGTIPIGFSTTMLTEKKYGGSLPKAQGGVDMKFDMMYQVPKLREEGHDVTYSELRQHDPFNAMTWEEFTKYLGVYDNLYENKSGLNWFFRNIMPAIQFAGRSVAHNPLIGGSGNTSWKHPYETDFVTWDETRPLLSEEYDMHNLILDLTAIILPAADVVHGVEQAARGNYTNAALFMLFGIIPGTAGPLVDAVAPKIGALVDMAKKSPNTFKENVVARELARDIDKAVKEANQKGVITLNPDFQPNINPATVGKVLQAENIGRTGNNAMNVNDITIPHFRHDELAGGKLSLIGNPDHPGMWYQIDNTTGNVLKESKQRKHLKDPNYKSFWSEGDELPLVNIGGKDVNVEKYYNDLNLGDEWSSLTNEQKLFAVQNLPINNAQKRSYVIKMMQNSNKANDVITKQVGPLMNNNKSFQKLLNVARTSNTNPNDLFVNKQQLISYITRNADDAASSLQADIALTKGKDIKKGEQEYLLSLVDQNYGHLGKYEPINLNEFKNLANSRLVDIKIKDFSTHKDAGYGAKRIFSDMDAIDTGMFGAYSDDLYSKFGSGYEGHNLDSNTLFHVRYATDANTPKTLNILEVQSDWATNKGQRLFNNYYQNTSMLNDRLNSRMANFDIPKLKTLKPKTDPYDINNPNQYNAQGKMLNEKGEVIMEEVDLAFDINNKEHVDYINNHFKKTNNTNGEAAFKDLLDQRNAYNADFKTQTTGIEGIQQFGIQKDYNRHAFVQNLKFAIDNGYTTLKYPTAETSMKIQGHAPLKTLDEFTEAHKLNDPNAPWSSVKQGFADDHANQGVQLTSRFFDSSTGKIQIRPGLKDAAMNYGDNLGIMNSRIHTLGLNDTQGIGLMKGVRFNSQQSGTFGYNTVWAKKEFKPKQLKKYTNDIANFNATGSGYKLGTSVGSGQEHAFINYLTDNIRVETFSKHWKQATTGRSGKKRAKNIKKQLEMICSECFKNGKLTEYGQTEFNRYYNYWDDVLTPQADGTGFKYKNTGSPIVDSQGEVIGYMPERRGSDQFVWDSAIGWQTEAATDIRKQLDNTFEINLYKGPGKKSDISSLGIDNVEWEKITDLQGYQDELYEANLKSLEDRYNRELPKRIEDAKNIDKKIISAQKQINKGDAPLVLYDNQHNIGVHSSYQPSQFKRYVKESLGEEYVQYITKHTDDAGNTWMQLDIPEDVLSGKVEIKGFQKGGEVEKIRKDAEDNPGWYSNTLRTSVTPPINYNPDNVLKEITSGKRQPSEEWDTLSQNIKNVHTDKWLKYLGYPQENETFIESKYKPNSLQFSNEDEIWNAAMSNKKIGNLEYTRGFDSKHNLPYIEYKENYSPEIPLSSEATEPVNIYGKMYYDSNRESEDGQPTRIPAGRVQDYNIKKDDIQAGIQHVESEDGENMPDENSEKVGRYGTTWNTISDQYEGDKEEFSKDEDAQNEVFHKNYVGSLVENQKGLRQSGYDLYWDNQEIADKMNYTPKDMAALTNLLGEKGAEEYLKYVLGKGQSMETLFPHLYADNISNPALKPDQYLKKFKEGVAQYRQMQWDHILSLVSQYGEDNPEIRQAMNRFGDLESWEKKKKGGEISKQKRKNNRLQEQLIKFRKGKEISKVAKDELIAMGLIHQ